MENYSLFLSHSQTLVKNYLVHRSHPSLVYGPLYKMYFHISYVGPQLKIHTEISGQYSVGNGEKRMLILRILRDFNRYERFTIS